MAQVKTEGIFLAQGLGLFARLMTGVPEKHLRSRYWKQFWKFVRNRKNPGAILLYVMHLAMHYHAYTMTRAMATGRTRIVNSY